MIGVPDRAAYCASKGAVIALHARAGHRPRRRGHPRQLRLPGHDRLAVDRAPGRRTARRATTSSRASRSGGSARPRRSPRRSSTSPPTRPRFSTGSPLVVDGGMTAATVLPHGWTQPRRPSACSTRSAGRAEAAAGSAASRRGRSCRSRPSTASSGGSWSAATRAPRATACTCSGRGSSRWRAGCSTSSTPGPAGRAVLRDLHADVGHTVHFAMLLGRRGRLRREARRPRPALPDRLARRQADPAALHVDRQGDARRDAARGGREPARPRQARAPDAEDAASR